ncbi:MAG TPA: ABC transporter permease, partial [Solirubrobacteraceae bacterium]|nr:ABC transporter permease [Solirubrobacteraceae bacterium]
ALDEAPEGYWPDRWLACVRERGRQSGDTPPAQPSFQRPRAGRAVSRQVRTLASRYFVLYRRDRRNLVILLGQVPLLGLLVALLFHSDVLVVGNGQSVNALTLVFLMVVIVVWCGSIDSAREIIKERAVFERERAIGVRNTAFLLSKTSLLFSLTLVQSLVLCGLVLTLRPLHEQTGAYLVFMALLVLTSWVAVTLGLLLSATVRTENQATSFIPLILIPELILSGGATPLHQLPSAAQALASIIFPRWSFAALGDVLHFNARFASDPGGSAQFRQYGHSFFQLSPWVGAGMLVLFLSLFATGVLVSLTRDR